MLKTLKVNGNENEILFVSDLHHNHDREFLWGKRGFKSVEEHDSALIHRWNEVCTNRSVVFSLGDEQFNDPTGEKFKNLLRRLNFKTLYCLTGNHFSGRSAVYKEELKLQFPNVFSEDGLQHSEVYPLWHNIDGNPFKQIVFLPTYVEAKINGWHFVLCHFPIYSHHKQSHGAIGLFGHCHQNCALTNKNTGKGKRLDLGLEGFGRPITLAEVNTHLKNRDLDVVDHHDESS